MLNPVIIAVAAVLSAGIISAIAAIIIAEHASIWSRKS